MKNLLLLFLLFTISLNAKVEYEKYCSNKTLRETNILIDMHNIDNKLYGKIIQHLTYVPNERVNIFAFDGETNSLENVMEYCYPQYTKKEIDSVNANTSTFRLSANANELMKDDQAIFTGNLTQKLANIRKKISMDSKGDFQNAIRTVSKDINEYGRLILFTTRNLKKTVNIDFKRNNVYVYNKKLPSKNKENKLLKFFDYQNGNFKGIKSRSTNNKYVERLKYVNKDFNLLINSRKVKANISGLFDSEGKMENVWFSIKGIISSPLVGKINFNDKDNEFSLNAIIPKNIKLGKNILKKEDKLDLKLKNGKLNGKYYNHAYVFSNDTEKYFEYRITK